MRGDDGTVVAALDEGSLSAEHLKVVSLSPDAKRLATGGPDDAILIWNLQTGRLITELPGHGAPVKSFGWSPDGVWLATASPGHGIKIWNTHTGKVKVFHSETGADTHHPDGTGLVYKLVWASDNNRLAVSYKWHNWLWIIDTETGANSPMFETDDGGTEFGYEFEEDIWAMAWNRDSSILAVGSGKDIFLMEPESFEITHTLTGHQLTVMALQWGPDGLLASGGLDKTVKIWNTDSGQPLHSFLGHAEFPRRLSWNPEGTRLVSSDASGIAKVWDLNTKTPSSPARARHRFRFGGLMASISSRGAAAMACEHGTRKSAR